VSGAPAPARGLEVVDVLLASDGEYAEELVVRAPGSANGRHWLVPDFLSSGRCYPSMNGRSVILHAVRKLAAAAEEITSRNGVAAHEVDVIVPHQANANLLRSLAARLSVPAARIVVHVDRYGNTSGVSAFLALDGARAEGRVRAGSWVLILAFGAGFTWGAALCRGLDGAGGEEVGEFE
jgi:3-oxoacyl-[acyl-carrier-protein] synthase III